MVIFHNLTEPWKWENERGVFGSMSGNDLKLFAVLSRPAKSANYLQIKWSKVREILTKLAWKWDWKPLAQLRPRRRRDGHRPQVLCVLALWDKIKLQIEFFALCIICGKRIEDATIASKNWNWNIGIQIKYKWKRLHTNIVLNVQY